MSNMVWKEYNFWVYTKTRSIGIKIRFPIPVPVLWRFDSPPDCPAKFSAGMTKKLKFLCQKHALELFIH